jgi:hypothetical protein
MDSSVRKGSIAFSTADSSVETAANDSENAAYEEQQSSADSASNSHQ